MRLRILCSAATIPLLVLGMAALPGCRSSASIGGNVETTPPPPPPPPPPDGDGDGILDPDDRCPAEKEDGAPPNPSDGCPNADADGDGIPVPQDKCPNEPETVNQYQDDDGCPDAKPLVQLVGTRVQINQKIQFKHASADIEADSTPILDAVADVLKKNPDIRLIEVGGHASKEGDAWYNRTLTQKRSQSVAKALVERGIDKDRLAAQGYGFYCLIEDVPAAAKPAKPAQAKPAAAAAAKPGDKPALGAPAGKPADQAKPTAAPANEEMHEKNRRVEFKILYRAAKWTDETRGCAAAEKAGIKPKKLAEPKPPEEKKAPVAKPAAPAAKAPPAPAPAAKPVTQPPKQ